MRKPRQRYLARIGVPTPSRNLPAFQSGHRGWKVDLYRDYKAGEDYYFAVLLGPPPGNRELGLPSQVGWRELKAEAFRQIDEIEGPPSEPAA